MHTQNQLEKTSREKIAVMAELEIARGHIDNSNLTYGQVRVYSIQSLKEIIHICVHVYNM